MLISVLGVERVSAHAFLPQSRRITSFPGFVQRLDHTWQELIRSSVSLNTNKQYATGQKKFLNFCALLGAAPCPATEILLLRFVASVSDSLRGSTIQNYLSAIRFMHVCNGFDNPLSNFERLRLVVRALKKRSESPRQRSPVSIGMLRKISTCLNFRNYNDTLLWAMIICGFFGFMRVSEFTVLGEFDP